VIGRASRRKEEPAPYKDPWVWLSIVEAKMVTRKADSAIRRIQKRMLRKGLIKTIKGGELE